MDVRYARSGDAHLAYRVDGDSGPYLLFIAPYTISIDSLDDEPHSARFFRRLTSFTRLIRYDMRGIGLSDPIDPTRELTADAMATDALAVLDAVGAERMWIWGSSGAGAIAVLLALLAAGRVEGLVLTNTYARLIRADDYPIGYPRHVVESFVRDNADPDAEWTVGGDDDVAIMAPGLRDNVVFREYWARASKRGASPHSARTLIASTVAADVRVRLPEISVATLVLHRRDDAFVPAAHGRYLAQNIPRARFVELPGADHIEISGDMDALVDEVELFVTGGLGRSGAERVLTTVLFTDIVESTKLAAAMGDRRWRDQLDAHDAIVREQLNRLGGREVNTTGDGFFAAFDGPTQAVRCGQAIVAASSAVGVPVRAGVHTGECERRGNDLAGLTVHIAARVAAAAASGRVLVTRTVRDLVAGTDLRFESRGEQRLKGVPDAWELFETI